VFTNVKLANTNEFTKFVGIPKQETAPEKSGAFQKPILSDHIASIHL